MTASMTPGLVEEMLAALHGAEGRWGPSADLVDVSLRLESAEDMGAVARALEDWGAVVVRAEPAGPALQARIPPARLWDLLGLDGVLEVAEGASAPLSAPRGRLLAAVGLGVLAAGLVVWWTFGLGSLSPAPAALDTAKMLAAPAQGDLPDTGVVAAILTGDRIRLNSGQVVRMAGLRAPAYNDPERGDEIYGSQARRVLSELVAGKAVALAYPPQPKLPDGALSAFVTLADGTEVNAALIEQGAVHANLATAGAPRRAAFGRLEAEARRARRGLWDGPVVGNLASKVYHLPGGRFYYRVGSANRVLFADEAEARGAGYRRSAR